MATTKNRNDAPTTALANLREHNKELREAKKQLGEYKQRLGTLFATEKKLLRRHQRLVKFKEPVLWLIRRDGRVEYYDDCQEEEFKVPGLKTGVERSIYLNKNRQYRFDYAGREFYGYICHEDYAFPMNFETNEVWVKSPGTETYTLEKIEMAAANINSEAHRDLMRKVLIAWEKFTADSSAELWKSIAKIAMWVALAGLGVFFILKYFGRGDVTTAQVIANVTNETIRNATLIARTM